MPSSTVPVSHNPSTHAKWAAWSLNFDRLARRAVSSTVQLALAARPDR
jgi:hypothetical protein